MAYLVYIKAQMLKMSEKIIAGNALYEKWDSFNALLSHK